MNRVIAVLSVLFAVAGVSAKAAPDIPLAIYQDPPVDTAHPAGNQSIQFQSHGQHVNGQIYRPAGVGPFPTVILLHGLPGNEQSLDLARVMQRAGWTVVTFHYRGSWGSGGTFTLKGGCEDAEALLALLESPEKAAAWGIDPKRMVFIGHSYGGYVAACAVSKTPGVLGTALIAPWDISEDMRVWGKLPPAQRLEAGKAAFDDVDGRLAGADAVSLTNDIVRDGGRFDLSAFSAALAAKPLLVLTATRDDRDDQATGLLAALKTLPNAPLTTAVMDTDHPFNDHRIALQIAVLRWLATLPGAPAPH
jgi:pimeloyl-ACP methyl ester carboxylesterase